jgi:hypothetical protein
MLREPLERLQGRRKVSEPETAISGEPVLQFGNRRSIHDVKLSVPAAAASQPGVIEDAD